LRYILRRLKQIRRYVEPDVIHSLVHASVTSHLDYCNGLLAGCNAYTVRRLQRVQNTAARLELDVPYSSRSQPLLRQLHWLPIESRVKFKLCVLMYRVSHGTAPLYLCELCKPNCASHVLTVDYAPNQEATSVLHGLVSDLLTKLSPSQRHLPGTYCQLTFVIVVARQHSRNISRLSCFMELLICISILLFYFYFTLSVVLYGAVEHWLSGALVNVGDII